MDSQFPDRKDTDLEAFRQQTIKDIAGIADSITEQFGSIQPNTPMILTEGLVEPEVIFAETKFATVFDDNFPGFPSTSIDIWKFNDSVEPFGNGWKPVLIAMVVSAESLDDFRTMGRTNSETFEILQTPSGKLVMTRDFTAHGQDFEKYKESRALQSAMGLNQPGDQELTDLLERMRLGLELRQTEAERAKDVADDRTHLEKAMLDAVLEKHGIAPSSPEKNSASGKASRVRHVIRKLRKK